MSDSVFVVEGFRFDGWDKEFTNVKDNLEIDAKLTAMTQICFVSIDTTKCDTVPVDTTITIKEDPTSNDSLTCDAWLNGEVELHVGDELTVAQLTTLEAKCSVNMFDVIFYVQQKTYNGAMPRALLYMKMCAIALDCRKSRNLRMSSITLLRTALTPWHGKGAFRMTKCF